MLLLTPFRRSYIHAQPYATHGDLIEIYCKASLETCEARDIKDLYKRARKWEIKHYTGIDSPL